MMLIEVTFGEDATPKELDVGGVMNVPYEAILTDAEIEVRLEVDVIDGHVSCTSYSVRAVDGRGLEHRTTEIFRGMKLREILGNVIAIVPPPGSDFDMAATIADTVSTSVNRTRRPVDDERLRDVAARYVERGGIGGTAGEKQFAADLGVGVRQMYRLVKLAEDRGFLKGEN